MNKLVTLVILGILVATGCNRHPATYPVKGRVSFPSGSPVRMGTIETKSRDLGINARGSINSDGSFELTTFEPGDGAVAGWHDCVIVQMVMHGEELKGKVSNYGVVDPRHNAYSSSGLSFRVTPEQTNEITLEVTPLRGVEAPEKSHTH